MESQEADSPEAKAFQDWLLHPVTKQVRSLMVAWREGLKDQWAHSVFNSENPMVMIGLNSRALGQIELLERFHELDWNELKEGLEKEDEE